MGVDHAGQDVETARFENLGGRGVGESADRGDAVRAHADVGGNETGGRGADAAADQEIEALGHRASSTVMMSPSAVRPST